MKFPPSRAVKEKGKKVEKRGGACTHPQKIRHCTVYSYSISGSPGSTLALATDIFGATVGRGHRHQSCQTLFTRRATGMVRSVLPDLSISVERPSSALPPGLGVAKHVTHVLAYIMCFCLAGSVEARAPGTSRFRGFICRSSQAPFQVSSCGEVRRVLLLSDLPDPPPQMQWRNRSAMVRCTEPILDIRPTWTMVPCISRRRRRIRAVWLCLYLSATSLSATLRRWCHHMQCRRADR